MDYVLECLAGFPCPFEESWNIVVRQARFHRLKSMSVVINGWFDAEDRERFGYYTYRDLYDLAHGVLLRGIDSELRRRARKISLRYVGEMPRAEAPVEPREDFSASSATSLQSPPGSVRSKRTTTPVPSPSTQESDARMATIDTCQTNIRIQHVEAELTVAGAVQTCTDIRPITLEIPQVAADEHLQICRQFCRARRADQFRQAADQAEPAEEFEQLKQPSWISSAWTSVCSWVSTRMTSLSSWWT